MTRSLPQDFERQLRTIALRGEAGALQAGRVSIIGLDRVKGRMGDLWERVAERVRTIARSTIERYLMPGDIFTDFGDTGYLIVFSSLDIERARMKCLLIAERVMKALLGEDGAELISIGTAVAQLDGTFTLDDMMSSNQPLEHAPRAVAGADHEDKLERVTLESTAAREQVPRFVFRPMWDTAKGILSTYLCVPGDEDQWSGNGFGKDPEWLLHHDLAVQKRGLDELARALTQGCKVLIGFSVHFETLAASSYRRQYLQTLQQGLTSERARFLVLEVAGVPNGVPESRLLDLMTPLKKFSRAVVTRFSIEAIDFGACARADVTAVGCNADPGAPELTTIQLMTRFNRAAEKAHLATYIRGLRSVSLMAAAVGAGFRYIEGNGIGDVVQHPPNVVKFNLSDMYRAVLR